MTKYKDNGFYIKINAIDIAKSNLIKILLKTQTTFTILCNRPDRCGCIELRAFWLDLAEKNFNEEMIPRRELNNKIYLNEEMILEPIMIMRQF